ncbi:MAG: phosphatidylserine decarboxylase [Solobacterium sp.]|nr:phosphatidylserine decarboxylase [Solobacterium sp.]
MIVYDKEQQRCKEYFFESIDWQLIETKDVVIIQMDSGALASVVSVGMCQVSSVNFENTVVPGAHVKKGDPLGYFLFGGSDIIMLFSEDTGFTLTAEALAPIKACELYVTLK